MRKLVIRPALVVGTVVALLIALMCVRFGFWQLERRTQRAALNDAVESRMSMPPMALEPGVADSTGLIYRRVTLSGDTDPERTFVWVGRMYRGSPGVHLLMPVRQPGRDHAVLLDRGWVPSPDAFTVDVTAYPEEPAVLVEGIVLPLPDADPTAPGREAGGRTIRRLDRAALEVRLPYSLPPFYVQRLGAPRGEATVGPRALPLPELDPGPHLGYAIQWFSFAAIALGGWLILLMRRGAGGGAE